MNIRRIIRTAALLLAAFGFAGSAYAVTPANSLLTNEAKLTYAGNTTTGIIARVSVEVQLVEASVTALIVPLDVTLTEGQAYSDTFVIQSNANGPDSYTIATTVTDGDSDITGEDTSVTLTGVTSPITLGATALSASASSGASSFTVPGDGTTGGGVNGLVTGDFVVIKGKYYQIESVTENGTDPALPATIAIDATPTGGPSGITFETDLFEALTAGEGVYEFVAFSTDLDTVGTQATPGTEGEIEVNITISNGVTTDFTDQVVITVVRVTFTKYVRNVTADGDAGRDSFLGDCSTLPAATITYSTQTYYLTLGTCEVNVLPDDTLEYLLTVKADDNSDITDGTLSDTLPPFTVYTTGSTKLNNQAVDDETSGAAFPLDSTADQNGLRIQDDAATAQATGAEGSGTVTQAETAYVVYQVDVDA